MAKDPAFSFYVNDFEGGTRHMTDEELGCYLRVLIAQFNRGGVLPNDEKFLARFCTSFSSSWPMVKEKFKVLKDGNLQNERLEIERIKRENFVSKQQENGKKGGRPKKPKKNPQDIPRVNPQVLFGLTQKKPLDNGNDKGNTILEEKKGVEKFPFDVTMPPWCLEACERNQFTMTQARNTGWILEQWEIFVIERANDPPLDRAQYQRIEDLTRYFTNWIRNKKPINDGRAKTTTGHRAVNAGGPVNGIDPTRIEREGPGDFR